MLEDKEAYKIGRREARNEFLKSFSTEDLMNAYKDRVSSSCFRLSNSPPSDPQGCDWPNCQCDPMAEEYIDRLRESGWSQD